MNHSDSERLASFLESKGFELAEKIDSADLVIINTCGVRQMAEDRVYGMIHNIRKKEKLEAKSQKLKTIIMTGCIAHRKDVQRRMKGKVDLFTEIKDFTDNFNKLKIANKETKTTSETIDYLSINPKHTNSFQAFIPIMTGCNNFCAYCVVPHARGRETSRAAEEILSEVKNIIAQDCKHITLLGQNVNSYRGTFKGKEINFAKLLKMIDKISGKFWITFTSSHPKDMSDELIETIAKCKKVCESVHLPVQAGNDEVLRRMNRKYTQKHYLGRISKIRSSFKKYKPKLLFSISSDIIVGFPGETKKQFEDSEIVMKKAKFDMVYFGQFSPRPGTAAWQMKNNISKKEKERREKALNEILKKTALANSKKYISTTQEVLLEKEKNGAYFGKTRSQKNVKIVSKKKIAIGNFTKVKITKANIWNLEGEIK